MTKLYIDAYGQWWLGEGNVTFPIRCSFYNNRTSVQIVSLVLGDQMKGHYNGPISGLTNASGIAYADYDALMKECSAFFVKASGAGGVVVAEIKLLASLGAVPSGWLVCNGASVSNFDYPSLFKALTLEGTVNAYLNATAGTIDSTANLFVGMKAQMAGDLYTITAITNSTTFSFTPGFPLDFPGPIDTIFYSYGTDAPTTFKLPDLAGRVPVGRDLAQSEFNAVGETGGAKTHTLLESQMPSHTHPYTFPNRSRSVFGTGGDTALDGGTTTYNTSPKGGGLAHNNLQPYIVMNYIIKY